MSRPQTLLQSLRDNVTRIEATVESIETLKKKQLLTEEDVKTIESLYRAEFLLYLDNSSIYDDLIHAIRDESEFTKRRIGKEAKQLLKSEIIEMGDY